MSFGADRMELTEKQRKAIDEAYRKKLHDEPLTSDEVDMLIAFERDNAVRDAEEQAKIDIWQKESEERIKTMRENAAYARDEMRKRANALIAGYERTLEDEPQQK